MALPSNVAGFTRSLNAISIGVTRDTLSALLVGLIDTTRGPAAADARLVFAVAFGSVTTSVVCPVSPAAGWATATSTLPVGASSLNEPSTRENANHGWPVMRTGMPPVGWPAELRARPATRACLLLT